MGGWVNRQEHWQGPAGEELDSCAILTTEANELMSSVHRRMPLILDQKNFDLWLDPEFDHRERLEELMISYPSEKMIFYPVSSLVNNPANDLPEILEHLEPR